MPFDFFRSNDDEQGSEPEQEEPEYEPEQEEEEPEPEPEPEEVEEEPEEEEEPEQEEEEEREQEEHESEGEQEEQESEPHHEAEGFGSLAEALAAKPHAPPSKIQTYGDRGVEQSFQYSQCTGKKKALLVGINYFGQDAELSGCINDVTNMKNFLIKEYGYKANDMLVLTDNSEDEHQQPTRANILQAMGWLVKGAKRHDALFFHYSGHGGQTKDLSGDEADGFDEVIYPVDFNETGEIVDDLMHETLVKPLPAGCRLTAIFDSCHSGSVLDLPYIYSTEGKLKEPNLAIEAGKGLLTAFKSYQKGDKGGAFRSAMGVIKQASGAGDSQKADKLAKATRTSSADVISWSGCKDSQTSADAVEDGKATGAMSWAFIKSLKSNKGPSYQQLLVDIRGLLKEKYEQKPQLSSSHPMDVGIVFIC
ncbi:hypothetical protein GALMADRAFT_236691 [Galerina marginata CBS 339.88]|uniref:Peptidase C14 caspase domain-containing protein n=1 Tax=Galerina marginata (strain CBS 339.88) TaxID=685588 RepID=A0A067TLN9_GALM3|nr:hypothetical protein GALMADRAFT_236691 [Galerina marginata CBS 339.88]